MSSLEVIVSLLDLYKLQSWLLYVLCNIKLKNAKYCWQ